jgi:hypothetical protein
MFSVEAEETSLKVTDPTDPLLCVCVCVCVKLLKFGETGCLSLQPQKGLLYQPFMT